MISCENDNVVNDHTADGEAAWSFSQRGDPPMRPQQRVFSHPWNVHFRYHMFFTSLYINNYTQNILYCLCLSASSPPPSSPPPPPPPSSSQHFVWTTNVSPASVLSPSSQQQQSKWESDTKLELMKKILKQRKKAGSGWLPALWPRLPRALPRPLGQSALWLPPVQVTIDADNDNHIKKNQEIPMKVSICSEEISTCCQVSVEICYNIVLFLSQWRISTPTSVRQ